MLQYTPTKEDYASFLRVVLRKKNRGLKGLIMCVMGLILIGMGIWYAVSAAVSLPLRILIFLFSFLLGATRVFRYFGTEFQLKLMLKEMDRRGAIQPDFWQAHSLSVEDDSLKLCFGSVDTAYPLTSLRELSEADGMLLINIAGEYVEFVPAGQYSAEQLTELREAIDESLHRNTREQVREHYERMKEEALFEAELSLSPEEYALYLARAKRHSYRFLFCWSRQELIRVIAPPALALYFLLTARYGYMVLALMLFFSLNFSFFMTFTSNYVQMVYRGLPSFRGGYRLLATKKLLNVYSDRRVESHKLNDVKAEYTAGDGTLFLYISRDDMAFIPAELVEAYKKSRPIVIRR